MNKINNLFSFLGKKVKDNFNMLLGLFKTSSNDAPHEEVSDNTYGNPHGSRFFIFVLIFLLTGYYIATISSKNLKENARIEKSKNLMAVSKPALPPNPFDSVSVQARSAYVLDVKNNKVLFSKNESALHPLASLTKVMTALTAYQTLPDDTIIRINKEAIRQDGDNGLYIDEQWKIKDLIDLTLVASSNDGAYALAEKSQSVMEQDGDSENFIEKMNNKALEIGLKKTFFNNATGLDYDDEIAGGYGSAEDMANLFSYIIKNNPKLLEATKYSDIALKSLDGLAHNIKNTDPAVSQMPAIIGSKTGFTDLAQGNVILAFDAGMDYPIIISILGSTYEGRFSDAENLIRAVLDYYGNNLDQNLSQ